MNVDKFFNIKVIISELEQRFNDDYATDVSGITDGQTETVVVAEVVNTNYITVGEVGGEVEDNIFP